MAILNEDQIQFFINSSIKSNDYVLIVNKSIFIELTF